MKKAFIVCFLLCFLFSLCACSKKEDSSASSGALTSPVSSGWVEVSSTLTEKDTNSAVSFDFSSSIAKEDALDILRSHSQEKLELPRPLSDYKLAVNDKPVVVEGKACYLIKLYDTENNQFIHADTFAVAADGSAAYKTSGTGTDAVLVE